MIASRTCRARVVVGLLAVVFLTLSDPSVPADAAETIVVTPHSALVDGQVVLVTGSGYAPRQRLEIFECRAGAVDEFDCDPRNGYEFEANDFGNVVFEFKVDARIYIGDANADISGLVPVDCRAEPGACIVGLGYVIDADEAVTAPLDFDPNAPLLPVVTMSVSPTDELVDGQELTVTGEHLTDREETFVYQCVAGRDPSGTTCDFGLPDVRGVAAPDGTITLYWKAKATMFPPLGGSIDCTTGPGACDVVLSWSFIGAPDRIARTPISFAGLPNELGPKSPSPPTADASLTSTAPTFTG